MLITEVLQTTFSNKLYIYETSQIMLNFIKRAKYLCNIETFFKSEDPPGRKKSRRLERMKNPNPF